jgi:hypothetical protein
MRLRHALEDDMRTPYNKSLARVAVAGLIAVMTGATMAGQSAAPTSSKPAAYVPPKTADGQPDLQGVWANNNATPLERPKTLEGRATLTPQEVAAMQKRSNELFGGDGDAAFGDAIYEAVLSDVQKYKPTTFDKDTGNYNAFWIVGREYENRTSLITDPPDGKVPAMTEEAQKRMASFMAAQKGHEFDGHENRPLSERCITFGFPDLFAGYNSYYQIVQGPGYVAILSERIHDVRIIPLDGRPHLAKNVRQMLGDSRGHWEGNTLVIDTTNLSATNTFRGASENMHLVERYTRTAADRVSYEVTISDPTTWTKPWTLMIPLKHTDDAVYEYACHEGNSAMIGVLAGARAQEGVGTQKTTSPQP